MKWIIGQVFREHIGMRHYRGLAMVILVKLLVEERCFCED